MVTLFDVNEQNWLDVVSLSVTEEQQKFLAAPMEIVAIDISSRHKIGRAHV